MVSKEKMDIDYHFTLNMQLKKFGTKVQISSKKKNFKKQNWSNSVDSLKFK